MKILIGLNKNILVFCGFLIIYSLVLPIFYPIAAKLLPRFQNQAITRPYTSSISPVSIKPFLRADRRALNVSFSNITKAKSVCYLLYYQAQGLDKGVNGCLDSSAGNQVNRELVFGTESSGVFRFDENITSAKLEVTTELFSGKKTMKRFRIRI